MIRAQDRLHVAVIGSGAAGLSAAWLLARRHRVTLLERDRRLGGHAHTVRVAADVAADGDHDGADGPAGVPGRPCAVEVGGTTPLDIDTGFIVYNEPCYPNLARWFETLGVPTAPSEMSFAVSRDGGRFEYAGGPPLGLLAQPSLLLGTRFWSMLRGLLRFYREARTEIPADASITLGAYLAAKGYPRAFVDDHLMPFAAAVWSSPTGSMLDYPAAAFIRFCDSHGLLQLGRRPEWRTVLGGSRRYVEAVAAELGAEHIVTGFAATRVERGAQGVRVHAADGAVREADHVVLATHADEALACLDSPDALERELLGPFAYQQNVAVLHTDVRYLPRRRRAWCSWNHVERRAGDTARSASVSYWMNRLQRLATETDYIVTLNPEPPPPPARVVRTLRYAHPRFTPATYAAQQRLWSLQGRRRTWFCGSYFGAGFHEDAVQAGFAVAERLGGGRRPWRLAEPSARIVLDTPSGQNGGASPADESGSVAAPTIA